MNIVMEMYKRANTVQSATEPAEASWKMTNDETRMTKECPKPEPAFAEDRYGAASPGLPRRNAVKAGHSLRLNYPKFPGNDLPKVEQPVPRASERGIAIIIVMFSIFVLAMLA